MTDKSDAPLEGNAVWRIKLRFFLFSVESLADGTSLMAYEKRQESSTFFLFFLISLAFLFRDHF